MGLKETIEVAQILHLGLEFDRSDYYFDLFRIEAVIALTFLKSKL